MKFSSVKLVAFLLTTVAGLSLAHAQDHAEAPLFDATALAHSCLNCHHANGTQASAERMAIPNIINHSAETNYQLLVAFQQETLPPNTTIMNRLIGAFNEDELKAIAEAVAKMKVAQ